MTYSDVSLMIDGAWTGGAKGRTIPVVNPATEEAIGKVAHAENADLDRALAAADKGFRLAEGVGLSSATRSCARRPTCCAQRADEIATHDDAWSRASRVAEAKGEVLAGADIIDWFAEEGRRTYGRIIPARAEGVYQLVIKEPVGPVAAFTPWNFPINQVVRKLSAALAAGCSIIVKAPEETPASLRRAGHAPSSMPACRRA